MTDKIRDRLLLAMAEVLADYDDGLARRDVLRRLRLAVRRAKEEEVLDGGEEKI